MTPRPYDTGHAYRTAQWVSHYAVGLAVVLGLVSLSLVGVIFYLLPLKEIRPYLVTTHSRSDQVIEIEPLHLSKKATTMLMDTLVRQYVMMREPIDFQSEPDRWDKVLKFSSDTLAKAFYELYKQENPQSPFIKFKKEDVTRSVIILSSTCLAPSAPDVWQVEWESIDKRGEEEIGRNRWVSTLTVHLSKRELSHDEQYINPVGMEVQAYVVSRKG